MNGTDIQALLAQLTKGGVLALPASANPLGSNRIDAFVDALFGGTLTATTGDAEVGAASVTFKSAQLHTPSFAFYGATGTVGAVLTFSTGSDQALDLSFAATMPAGWTIGASFPQIAAIKTSALNHLVFSAAEIQGDSGQSPEIGLLSATLTAANSAVASLEWLVGASVPVSGPVQLETGTDGKTYPRFALSSAPITGPNISGFSMSVSLNLRSTPGKPPLPDGTLPLLASLDITTDLRTPALTLPIVATITGPDQTVYPISLDPHRPVPAVTSLSQLQGFTLGQPISLGTDTPIGQLSLSALNITFDTASRTFSDLQVTVDLGTDWSVVNNVLELKGLEARLSVPTLSGGTTLPPQTPAFMIAVTAELLIVTANVNVTITYPDETISLALAPDTVVDVNAFLSTLAPGVSLPGKGDLIVGGLTGMADIKQKSYSFSCQATGDLTVIPNMVFNELDVALTYEGTSVSSFQFGCEFTLAKAPLYLAVAWAQENWSLRGGIVPGQTVNLSDLVADILSLFGVALPTDLPKIVLSQLDMDYETKAGSFSFAATVGYVAEDDPILKKVTGSVAIGYGGTGSTGWTGELTGSITLGPNELTVTYDFHESKVLTLSWKATGGATIGIADIAGLFGIAAPSIPASLDLALVELVGKYDITNQQLLFEAKSKNWGNAAVLAWNGTGGWSVLFGVTIDHPISLTSLPLIGKALAGTVGDVALDEIQFEAINGTLTSEQAQKILASKIIDAGYPQPPATGLAGPSLTMVFGAGGAKTPITLGTTPPAAALLAGAGAGTGTGTGLPAPAGQAAPVTSPDGTKWFSVQKSFGPVSIQKVGVRYDNESQRLWALMTASLAAGGLEIDVIGLGVGTPLTTFSPSFTIQGIELTLQEGPVALSGALVGTIDPINFYGAMVLDLEELVIGALGGYAEYEGEPSFFLYAVLLAPLGGPSFFFVTGLAAGFGFNRALVVPDVSGVATFPLVQWATGINAPGSDPSGDIAAQVQSVLTTLVSTGVVAPKIGEYWLAAGIRFTSFELLDSFALLTVSFGSSFEVDILGLSTLSLPPGGVEVFAEAQLELKASFSPSTGLLGIAGQLTNASFVISRDCHLTGGFAVYFWFDGPHAGEFVATLGGYSPNFSPPGYYPVVPRLGISWNMAGVPLTISGQLYFAITSSAVMAGGSLSAVWQSGGIRAWYTVQADFLMVFKPFHYYMSGSIELGASFKIDLLFTSVRISIHLGVGIQLWGPQFTGKVKVDLSIVSFTISFGEGQKGGVQPIPWTDFRDQLLPSSTTSPSGALKAASLVGGGDATPAIVQITPAQGLTKTLSDQAGALNWLVDPQTFQFTVQTAIPLKTYVFDPTGEGFHNVVLAPDSMQPQSNGQPITPFTDFGVGPTGTAPAQLTSNLEVKVETTEDGVFDAVRLLRNTPKALWENRNFDKNGVPQNVDPVNGTTLPNVLTGFTFVPTPPTPQPTLPILLQYLQYTIDPNRQSFSWSVPVVESTDPFTTETVPATIAAAPATANRPAILAAVGRAGVAVDTTVDVSTLADPSTYYLLATPVLRYLGESR